mmetsp:Transcript_17779/g.50672  ORF Transcript_17779/g.50672 Transcript_17779/m.50672 type:complete len:214 (+) Transcript_17779:827-1468(+)
MGQAITGVNDQACQVWSSGDVAQLHLNLVDPLGIQGQHRLNSDVQALDVEGLEHDLSCQLSVLRGVEGRLRQEEVMLLWKAAQVAEDGLLHEPLEVVPILDAPTPHGVRQRVRLRALSAVGFLTDVQVGMRRPQKVRLAQVDGMRAAGRVRHTRGHDDVWLDVPSVAHLRAPGADVDDDGRPSRKHPLRCLTAGTNVRERSAALPHSCGNRCR